MKNLPKITVVTPSFNQAQFLEETILSVINQNYPNLEYIVIDGGSTDQSIEIIKKYAQYISYWVSEKDNGQSDAINKGLARATGDIVAWLNSDDLYTEDAIWHAAEVYKHSPDADLIVGNGYRYGWPSKTLQRFCPRHLAFNLEALAYGLDYILQPSTFFSKRILDQVEYLDENLHYAMDWELWHRIGYNGKVVVTDHPLSLSREYSDTKTSSGGFKRWEEIRKLGQSMSGEECTPGSLFFFTETLGSYLTKSQDKQMYRVNDFSPLEGLWNLSRQLLTQATGTIDGFPLENSAAVTYYLPFVREENETHHYNLPYYPKITVITPSYNQGHFIEKTIKSVLDQNYPNLEYMIIDGGSKDDTVDIIKKYESKLTYWVSERDKGPAEAINKGFKRATGDIICWLNSDDCFANNSLFEVAKAFVNHNDIQVVYGHAIYIDENDEAKLMDHGYQKTKLYYGHQQPFEKSIEYWNTVYLIPQPTVFFRKILLGKYGLLDEEKKFIFDYAYFLKLTQNEIKFHLIDRVQAFYRIHSTSKTSGFEAFYPELYQYSREYWGEIKRSFFKYYYYKIKPFYSVNIYGKFKFFCRMVCTIIQVYTKIGNPEKHFVKLVRRR